MSEEVLTTLVVTFGVSGSGAEGVAFEADPVRNVDSTGEAKSSFTEDDDFFFLLNFDRTKVKINKVLSSDGQVFPQGPVSQRREHGLDFLEINSLDYKPSVSYKPNSPLSIRWVGRNKGLSPVLDPEAKTVDIRGGAVPCKAVVSYNVDFDSYKLVSPKASRFYSGEDYFEVVIGIYSVAITSD